MKNKMIEQTVSFKGAKPDQLNNVSLTHGKLPGTFRLQRRNQQEIIHGVQQMLALIFNILQTLFLFRVNFIRKFQKIALQTSTALQPKESEDRVMRW